MTSYKKSTIIVSGLAILTLTSLLFQNCSPLKSQAVSTDTTTDSDITDQAAKAGKLTWGSNSGTVSPDYQYSVVYTINFGTKNLKVSVNKGPLVTGLVSPVDKSISETQLAQIKNLLGKIKSSRCKDGAAPVGGGSDSLGIYSSANRTSPETVVYGTDCTGLSSSFYQAVSGFSELTSYLKSL